jgi:rhamnosyltransferase
MRISVIIPTLNAGASIGDMLSLLNAQDQPPHEIIVIDSSSADKTVATAKALGAKTSIIPRASFNHGKTRNQGALEASGDILVFMTQDALPIDNGLLSMLSRPLREKDIAATFGRQIPRHDASPLETFTRLFNYPDKGIVKGMEDVQRLGIKTFFISNACSSYRKDIFLQVGMFPEDVKANEDMLISARLITRGYKIAYVAEAKVIHSHNYSLAGQFVRYFRIGSSLRKNRWILNIARPEGEGLRFIKEQIQFVAGRKQYLWIPYIFLESVTKYAGFRIGLIAG